jgi:SPP1 gp7 family putative phage head morphogenesis protein
MADKAHSQTDEILAEMEQHLSAIYEEASADIEAKAQEYFDRFKAQDEEMRKKVKSGEITEAEYIEWRRKKMITGENWKKRQQYIANQYEHVNEIALAYINGKMPEIYVLNYNYSAEKITSAVKAAITIEPISADVIKAFADKHKTFLPLKTVNHRKYQRWCTQKINSAVLQGIFQGESVSTMAKRLESVTRMDKEAALRNARTMVTSAECKGRQDSYEQAAKDGIEIEREWIATNDMRTRHAHAFLNGKTVAVDEPFETPLQTGENLFITDRIMYPGDPEAHPANVYNCRCTIAAKVIGFKKR